MRSTGCLMHSLRKAFHRSSPENILLGQLRNLLFTIWMIVVIGLTLLLVVMGRRALHFLSHLLPLSETFISVWGYLRFVILALVMAISLGLLYQLALGQRRPLREVLPGVGSSLAAWMLLSMAFPIMWRTWPNMRGFTALSPPSWWCCCGCICPGRY